MRERYDSRIPLRLQAEHFRSGILRINLQEIVRPLIALEGDREIWAQQGGLACNVAQDYFDAIKVDGPLPEKVEVSNTFHLLPLLHILLSSSKFQVLCISRDKVSMYEGNRYVLEELPLGPVPENTEAALGTELTPPHLTVASYNGAIDTAVLEHHSRPSGLPLILVALPEYSGSFRQSTRNPYVLDRMVRAHPQSFTLKSLREAAWNAFSEGYQEQLVDTSKAVAEALSKGVGSDDVT